VEAYLAGDEGVVFQEFSGNSVVGLSVLEFQLSAEGSAAAGQVSEGVIFNLH